MTFLSTGSRSPLRSAASTVVVGLGARCGTPAKPSGLHEPGVPSPKGTDYRDALLLDRKDGRRHYWMWRALAGLFDDDNIAECWRELDMIRTSLGTRPNSVNDTLLLVSRTRLLATGEAAYADLTVNDNEVPVTQVRVPAEFLWEHLHDLGLVTHRLTSRPMQWIGDRQAIKERWIAIFQRIVDEARQVVRCTGPGPSVNH